MRSLGIDLGSKRIGVALSDANGTLASPYTVFELTADLAQVVRNINKVVIENQVETVVVGLPRSLSGELGRSATEATRVIEIFTKLLDAKVEVYDERFSTKIAELYMKDTGKSIKKTKRTIDSMAAAVILQSWLDSRSNANHG